MIPLHQKLHQVSHGLLSHCGYRKLFKMMFGKTDVFILLAACPSVYPTFPEQLQHFFHLAGIITFHEMPEFNDFRFAAVFQHVDHQKSFFVGKNVASHLLTEF